MTNLQVPYATPQAMRDAVLAHARKTARVQPQSSVDQLLRHFAYARLLARLFVLAPDASGLSQPPLLRLYPVACSVAEKLAATLTLHRGFPSTRFRDLVDLATIAMTQRLAAQDLHTAIGYELHQQDLSIPNEYTVPAPDAWKVGYTEQAHGLANLRDIDFEQAVALVKALLDPVLRGRREGSWRPERRAWEP